MQNTLLVHGTLKMHFLGFLRRSKKLVPSMKYWSRTKYPIMSPPPLRASLGRPKKARRKEEDELKDSSKIKRRGTS